MDCQHHQSTGIDRRKAEDYIRSQPEHHRVDMTYVKKAVFEFIKAG